MLSLRDHPSSVGLIPKKGDVISSRLKIIQTVVMTF